MQVRVVLCLLMVTLVVLGCASAPPEPPQTYEFDSATVVNAGFNAVWDAAIEFVAVAGLPIQTIDKDSGTIVSTWIDASRSALGRAAAGGAAYCDCGKNQPVVASTARGICTVSAKSIGDERTELDVRFVYRGGKTRGEIKRVVRAAHKGDVNFNEGAAEKKLAEKWGTRDCSSTGYLEGLVQAYIRAKAEGGLVPRVPVFRSPD